MRSPRPRITRRLLLSSLVVGLVAFVAIGARLGSSVSTQRADTENRGVSSSSRAAVTPKVTTTIETTSTRVACRGITLSPGANVPSRVRAAPAGTTFCFKPGRYVLTDVVAPKSDDRLISVVPRRAILTGKNVYDTGIRGYGRSGAQHVTVQGLVIEHFVNRALGGSALQPGRKWRIVDNEVAYNSNQGVGVSDGLLLRGNFIHHNGRYGFGGGPVSNLIVDRNEVSFNNTRHFDPNNDAGGSKIVGNSPGSYHLTFTNNYVHDNYGNGLWTDWDNKYVTYSGNRVTNNGLAGIFHEASFDAVITNNTVSNNCTLAAGKSLWFCAEILLNDSRNSKIYGNSVRARSNGIGLVDTDRGTTPLGHLAIANDHIHDNTIKLPGSGTVGIVSSSHRNPYAPAAKNNFVHNSYSTVNPGSRHWQWNGSDTWAEWRRHGQDLSGTVHASSS